MKTTEDYLIEFQICSKTYSSLIEEIKIDAFKAGMTEAAKVSKTHYEDQGFNQMYQQAGYQIEAAILSARDSKTTL